MASTFAFPNTTEPSPQQTSEIIVQDEKADEEQTEALQEWRQGFDMAIEQVIEGFVEAQHILNKFKEVSFSRQASQVPAKTKLKIQRTSHHCNRLLVEVQQLLQPFSQDL